MTGPSTNFYVGPQEKHYTIPKRLLYQFSDFAKACLEGQFSEATTNAVFLPDVDPDVFQYLWQWLYTGELKILRSYTYDWQQSRSEKLTEICRPFCRLHILGERLLFDYRFLDHVVQHQMEEVIKEVNSDDKVLPLSPEIIEKVLSESRPVIYDDSSFFEFFDLPSLRPFVLKHLSTFEVCTTVDFMDYANCFEKDGGFAAEIIIYLAEAIGWAKERCQAQVGRPVDVFRDREQVAQDKGSSQCLATRTKLSEGVWVVLKRICTSAEPVSRTKIRGFSNLFEKDGAFAAEFLNHLVTELLLTIERWGGEKGEKVNFVAEKAEAERLEQEEADAERACRKWRYR